MVALLGPLLTGLGTGVGSAAIGSLFGGSRSSGGSSSAGGLDPTTALYLRQYAEAAAAANAPLTAASQQLAALTGGYLGDLGAQRDLINSGQKTQIADSAGRNQTGTQLLGQQLH